MTEENKTLDESLVIDIRLSSPPNHNRASLTASLHKLIARVYKIPVVFKENTTRDVVLSTSGFDVEEEVHGMRERGITVRISSVSTGLKPHEYPDAASIPVEVQLKMEQDRVRMLCHSLRKIGMFNVDDPHAEAKAILKHILGNEFYTYMGEPDRMRDIAKETMKPEYLYTGKKGDEKVVFVNQGELAQKQLDIDNAAAAAKKDEEDGK